MKFKIKKKIFPILGCAKFGEAGMSLVEVMVAFGLSGIIVLGGAHLMTNSPNISKSGVDLLKEQSDVNLLVKTFVDRKKCEFNLKDLPVSSGEGLIDEIAIPLGGGSTDKRVVWRKNETDKNKIIRINDIAIDKVTIGKFKPLGPVNGVNIKPHLAKIAFYGKKRGTEVKIPALSFLIEVKAEVDSSDDSKIVKILNCNSEDVSGVGTTDNIEDICVNTLKSQYKKFGSIQDLYPTKSDDPRYVKDSSQSKQPSDLLHENDGFSIDSKIEGYCKKPYTFTVLSNSALAASGIANVRERDSLNAQNFLIKNSLFMSVKDKDNKTLDNSLYIGRYLENSMSQEIQLVVGNSTCYQFEYTYSKVNLGSSCPASNIMKVGLKPEVCVQRTKEKIGSYNTASKVCTYPATNDPNACANSPFNCNQFPPPGAQGFYDVLIMDKGDFYAANVGPNPNFPIALPSPSNPSPPMPPKLITTAVCNFEEKGATSGTGVHCSPFKMDGIDDTNVTEIMDRAFYSVNSTLNWSDKKLKENIKPLNHSSVLELKPRVYTWKENKKSSLGFVANEFFEIDKTLVKSERGALAINKIGLIPKILFTMKEQKKRLENIEKEINKMASEKQVIK